MLSIKTAQNGKKPLLSNEINFMQKANKCLIILLWVINSICCLGFILEYLKKGRPLGFTVILLSFLLFYLILGNIIYFKKPNSNLLRYFIALCYYISYAYVVLTGDKYFSVIFVFAIGLVFSVYADLKFTILNSLILFAMNIFFVVFKIANGFNSKLDTSYYSLQLGTLLMYFTGIIIITHFLKSFRDESIKNVETVEKNMEQQQILLKDILSVIKTLDTNADNVWKILNSISESSNSIKAAMSEISLGTNTTVDNIQKQTQYSENMYNKLMDTSNKSKLMHESSIKTEEIIDKGFSIVNNLSKKSDILRATSDNANERILRLKDSSTKIGNIIKLIDDIAKSTNLLALNASIEAARAGDSGKGFAVVAEEVRKLAMQSSEATNSISAMINELIADTEKSIFAFSELDEINKEQNYIVLEVKTTFNEINQNVSQVKDNISIVDKEIKELLTNIDVIVRSITEISAVSEETMANTAHTDSLIEGFIKQNKLADKIVKELKIAADNMKKYTEI